MKTIVDEKRIRRERTGSEIIIDSCFGYAPIYLTRDLFKSTSDEDFEEFNKLGLSHKGQSTPKTVLEISRLTGQGKISDFFGDISSDLDKLVLTHAQISRFCLKYLSLLDEKRATMFLTKSYGKYFAISVFADENGVGESEYEIYVVHPQQK